VLDVNAHDQTVIPDPKEHVVPLKKFVPVRFTDICACPCEPVFGLTPVKVGAGTAVTVMVRTGGLGLVLPAESVTVSDAMYTPAVENATFPGLASVLEFGLPPRIAQEYDAMEPVDALAEPAKLTDCPG